MQDYILLITVELYISYTITEHIRHVNYYGMSSQNLYDMQYCRILCHVSLQNFLLYVCLFITCKICLPMELAVSLYDNGVFTTTSAPFSQSGNTIHMY